uniref:MBL fold metallo-hydrolase n=1 Tax=Pararhizobium sp. IMCC3301 TaxID=3067904 RepID=UPI0027405445|nr:MBL fold metallo-hydrolase [Pararhizobium sp. IMCC3301]
MMRRKFPKYLSLSGVAAFWNGAARLASGKSANPYYSGPPERNFDGTLFFNPDGQAPRAFADFLKWQLFERRARWPETFPSPFEGTKPEHRQEQLTITMIGHATLLIQVSGLNFLTDPVFSDRASPLSFAGPKRITKPGVALQDLPPIDFVLLSHNHYDHLDLASLRALVDAHDPLIITPHGNDTIVRKAIPDAHLETGNWDDIVAVNATTSVHFEPVHHWSARGTRDRRMALWAGFVIEARAGKIYVVGDTGFHEGINYRAAAQKHGGFDAAILPIGAYDPSWFMEAQHQNPEEAVKGHLLCRAKVSIAHHWGTFQLTNEPLQEPVERLAKARSANNVAEHAFIILRPGEAWSDKTPSRPLSSTRQSA